MKKTPGMTAVVFAALGFWAGVSAYLSASFMTAVEIGLAVLFGGNLLLCLWLWCRAKPGSGDAQVLENDLLLAMDPSRDDEGEQLPELQDRFHVSPNAMRNHEASGIGGRLSIVRNRDGMGHSKSRCFSRLQLG